MGSICLFVVGFLFSKGFRAKRCDCLCNLKGTSMRPFEVDFYLTNPPLTSNSEIKLPLMNRNLLAHHVRYQETYTRQSSGQLVGLCSVQIIDEIYLVSTLSRDRGVL